MHIRRYRREDEELNSVVQESQGAFKYAEMPFTRTYDVILWILCVITSSSGFWAFAVRIGMCARYSAEVSGDAAKLYKEPFPVVFVVDY